MRFESTSSRVAASGARRSMRASKVRLESSMRAHSSPSNGPSTRRGSLPSSSSPSESASRFAGSMVTTATFRPRSAIPMAIAAAVVVLPTPPEPAQTTIRRPSSSSSMSGSPYPDRRALDVGDGNVDRAAAGAADADLERHLDRVHRRGEHVAALDAHVVVRPVAREHRPVDVLLDRGAAARRYLALAHPTHRHARHQSRSSFPVKSLIRASRTPAVTPSPIEAALPVIWALVLTVPPPSESA